MSARRTSRKGSLSLQPSEKQLREFHNRHHIQVLEGGNVVCATRQEPTACNGVNMQKLIFVPDCPYTKDKVSSFCRRAGVVRPASRARSAPTPQKRDQKRPDQTVARSIIAAVNQLPETKAVEEAKKKMSIIRKKLSVFKNNPDQITLQEKDEQQKVLLQVSSIYEDVASRGKFFLRINGGRHGWNEKVDEANKGYSTSQEGGKTTVSFNATNYTGFEGVIGPEKKNKDTFDQMQSTFDLLQKPGFRLMLFGYGFSGSGKTYSLFNEKEGDLGVVQQAKSYFEDIGFTFEMASCFELYGTIRPDDNSDIKVEINSQVICRGLPTEGQTFGTWLEGLTKLRKDEGTIKNTINNPESSRSHLFITFRVQNKGSGDPSYFTVVDMAGAEDPMVITKSCVPGLIDGQGKFKFSNFKKWLRTQEPTVGKGFANPKLQTAYQKETKIDCSKVNDRGKKKPRPKEVVKDTVREGMFINETIHILKREFGKLQSNPVYMIQKTEGFAEGIFNGDAECHEYTDTDAKKLEYNMTHYDPATQFVTKGTDRKHLLMKDAMAHVLGGNSTKFKIMTLSLVLAKKPTNKPNEFLYVPYMDKVMEFNDGLRAKPKLKAD